MFADIYATSKQENLKKLYFHDEIVNFNMYLMSTCNLPK